MSSEVSTGNENVARCLSVKMIVPVRESYGIVHDNIL